MPCRGICRVRYALDVTNAVALQPASPTRSGTWHFAQPINNTCCMEICSRALRPGRWAPSAEGGKKASVYFAENQIPKTPFRPHLLFFARFPLRRSEMQ